MNPYRVDAIIDCLVAAAVFGALASLLATGYKEMSVAISLSYVL